MGNRYVIATGNEACCRGAIYAGMSFFAGYPITPATEIAELASELLPKQGGVFMQMEDEIASCAAIIGASAAGRKAMTATSGPGFALMQEELGYAMINEIPLVIADVQRQGPSQGVATLPAQSDIMLTRWGVGGDHPSIVIAPQSVNEIYTETVRAFNLAEKYRTPVIILSDATLAHMSEKVNVFDDGECEVIERAKPTGDPKDYRPFNVATNDVVPLAAYGDGYSHLLCGLSHDDTGFPVNSTENTANVMRHLVGKIEDNIEDIESWEEYRLSDADVVVISIGIVSRSAKYAIDIAREEGIKVGLFRPITLWPFPGKRFSEVCKDARKVISVEMNLGQLSEIAKEYVDTEKKFVAVTQSDGTIVRAEKILDAIKEEN